MENVKRYLTQGKIPEYRESNKPEFCPILGGRTNDWVVDHDHKSGMVRGVISRLGNSLVGKVEDIRPATVLKRGRKKFAEDKTQKIVSEVEKLREQGLSIPDACKKVGTSTASYYAWRT